MKIGLAILVLFCAASAEIIDRTAIAIGYQVITESAIDEEIRVTALLNATPVQFDERTRHAAADRLIQQFLIKRDMEISRYAVPTTADVDAYIAQISNALDRGARMSQLLAEYRLTDATLRSHLVLQLMALRFVEFRFRPDLAVSDSDVQAYLERNHPDTASKERIRQLIIEDRTDAALSTWLEQARKRAGIVYLDKALQ